MVQAVNLTGRDFAGLMDQNAPPRTIFTRMMILGFSNPAVLLFYIVGRRAALPAPQPRRQRDVAIPRLEKEILRSPAGRSGALGLLAIFLGYISIPLACC